MYFPKHILITGANRGIGAALASVYAEKNIRLSLLGRKQEALEKIALQCKQQGAEVFTYCVDVRNTEQLQQTIHDIDLQQSIELVIANAGVANYLTASCDEENWQTIQTVLETNLMGAIATISPLVTRMRQRKKGQIALMSSLAAYHGMPISPAYCASKAGLKAYGEALQGLLHKDNIAVNIICPGFIESDMSDTFPGTKSFVLSAHQAAMRIKKGLRRNKACIVFPYLLYLGMKALTLLPNRLSNFILQILGYGLARK